ncbi:DNA polymerase III subunit gamma/tau [Leptothrix discophora]|uniref:DNA polymerase III subunit gamma/tau n=1 Tax=Leptothrix discophora TaxID=89 RepID=A0ABT9FZ91_LEPDI|nr:DNA polymerase III subunit gamma/tau [Leptothrix discophora]MDP4299475.1 DNA polymerase III subunit gamma/tau [Leptothrix discophora]
MSYVVLARKYRPRTFSEMVGQGHVVQALTNALTQQRLHHAYLFTGTRGVGKTTVSRILAKSLNCTGTDGNGGITATPCGVCSACRDIDAGRHVDYVELDAASNRGVDEISQLLDQAVYKPVVGRYKVYMIDEVHMLSTTAFNAMLKTLEEPPEYLKFVLATTDPQKVPVTVLSRCLQFNLRPMAGETVAEHLQAVLGAEQVPFEETALRLIARAAHGSMRDALSLTDQAIAYAGGELAEAAVRQMLGAVDRTHAVRIVEALGAADGAGLVDAVERLRGLGLSAAGLLEELCDLAQRLAVILAVPQALDPADPEAATLQALVPLLSADELQLLYSIALHGRAELALAPDEYSGLTMVLLRLLAFRPQGRGPGVTLPATAPAIVPAATRPAPAAAPQRGLLRPSSGFRAAPVAPASVPPAVEAPPWADQAVAAVDVVDVIEAVEVLERAAAKPANHSAAEAPEARLQQATLAADPSPEAPATDEPSWVRDEVDEVEPATMAVPSARAARPSDEDSAPSDTAASDMSRVARLTDIRTPQQDRWMQAIEALFERGSVAGLVRELAWQAECIGCDEVDGQTVWRLKVERESLRQASHRERLQAALTALLDRPQRLEVDAGVAVDSAARRDTAARALRQAAAEDLIHADPVVRQLLASFPSARIVPGSIRPR